MILAPVGNDQNGGAGGNTTGLHFGVHGNDRSKIFFTWSTVSMDSTPDVRPNTRIDYQATFDQWTHVVVQQEGGGLMRFYADGNFVAINFDRQRLGLMNEFKWSKEYSRSIGTDVRYILLLVGKYDGAQWLVDEMVDS